MKHGKLRKGLRLFPQNRPVPGGGIQILHALCVVIALPLLQPDLRPGMRIRRLIEIPDQLLQIHVVPPRAEIIRAGKKRRILRRILLLQEALHHILFQKRAFRVVHLPKSRIQIDLAEIIPEKERAEAVNRRNLRMVKKRLLPLKVPVLRVRLEPLGNRTGNSLPHLSRRRTGEGHNQQAVDVQRVLTLTDHAHDPLHQNRGLAASCRRGHQHVVVPGI